MKINKHPIIVKIISQRCTGYEFKPDYSASIIENVGEDANGTKYRFTTEHRRRNDDEMGTALMIDRHDYVMI
jgi:hypothetical protein